MAEQTTASTVAPGGAPVVEHEPSAWGISAGAWVAIAMLIVFAIALIKRVPALIAGMLDKRIDAIRDQLATAEKLRAEAEALKADYERRARDIHKEVEELRVSAGRQADAIVAKAEADATALIARHTAMAEDKIAAAERATLAEIRARAADAAAAAARRLIVERHGAASDRTLVDRTIAGLGRPH